MVMLQLTFQELGLTFAASSNACNAALSPGPSLKHESACILEVLRYHSS